MVSKKNKNEISKFLDDLAGRLSSVAGTEKDLMQEFQGGEIRISKDDKGARVNARIDAMMKGEEFDESSTPTEELETTDEDMMEELANREIDKIFGD